MSLAIAIIRGDRAAVAQLASCTGKTPYATFMRAVRRLKLRRRQHSRHRDPATVYRCRHCHKWHIGSTGL